MRNAYYLLHWRKICGVNFENSPKSGRISEEPNMFNMKYLALGFVLFMIAAPILAVL